MPRKYDYTGQQIGYWTVLSLEEKNFWKCRCKCGAVRNVATDALTKQTSMSCGCRKNKLTGDRSRTHGKSKTPEYRIWFAMKSRCTDANDPAYHNYGGRGIGICKRWLDPANFLADMGPRPARQMTLERIDNDGDYEPRNCCWASRSDQSRNTRNTIKLSRNGITMCVADWAKQLGVSRYTLYKRINIGWPVDRILSENPHDNPHSPRFGINHTTPH